MRYKIRLDTMADVNRFVGIATKYNGKIALTDGDIIGINSVDNSVQTHDLRNNPNPFYHKIANKA